MTILNKLQNYPWTAAIIHSLLTGTFIKNKKDYNTYVRRRYKTDFEIRKGKLFYIPLNLEVVPEDKPEEINRILESLYDRGEATGKGLNHFHQFVLQHYLGIRRKDVIAFLKTKPEYQLRQDKSRIVAKGFCDLINTRPWIWSI